MELFSESLIGSYVDDPLFTERPWLFDRVEGALADPGCRFVLVTGEPGSGKTAFMAWLARRSRDALRYFIRRDSRVPLNAGDARSLLFALGHQLAALRPALFQPSKLEVVVSQRIEAIASGGRAVGIRVEDLEVSPFYETALTVEQEAAEVSGELVGLSIGRMVVNERMTSIGNLQYLALLGPAALLASENPSARIVILVDALDELRYEQGDESALDWLASCPELPRSVRFILTSRPDDRLLELFRHRQREWLREEAVDSRSPAVRGDLERYTCAFVSQEDVAAAFDGLRLDTDRFVAAAVEKAVGNFQYLAALVGAASQAIEDEESGRLERVLNLAELPTGLGALYGFFLTLLRESVAGERVELGPAGKAVYAPAWEVLYQPVLGVLAVARETLAADQLVALTGFPGDERWLSSALARLRQFLGHEQGRYRLYHASLAEYLISPATGRDRPDDYLDAGAWHGRIAERCLQAWGGLDEGLPRLREDQELDGGYGLRHVAAHLSEAGRAAELHRLLSVEWAGPAGNSTAQNAWHAAHARAGDLSAYVADLGRAWRLAERDSSLEAQGGDQVSSIGLEARYALLTASVRSRAHGVPPALMLALVEKQLWNCRQALAYARQLPRAAERAEALRLLSTVLPARERTDVLKEALVAVRRIRGEDTFARELAPIPRERGRALVALAPQLTEPLLAEALATALPDDPEDRAKALTELVSHLPESLLSDALTAIRTIEHWPFLRAAPLAALAPLLPDHLRSEVVDEAMQAALQDESWETRRVLSELDPDLTELKRAAAIREIASARWRSSPRWLKEGQEQALENVRSDPNSDTRADELAELAPFLWGPGLARAFELAVALEPDRSRSTALVGLIPYLPEQLRLEALAAARKMTADPEAQARALAALALHMPEPTRSDLLDNLLALVPAIDPAGLLHGRLDVLGAVVPLLSTSQLAQALAAAEHGGDESARANALATMARRMPEPAKSEVATCALAVARESRDPWTLSNTLAALRGPLRDEALRETMAASRHVEDPGARASALANLLPHLADADKGGVVEEALAAASSSAPYDLAIGLAPAAAHLPESLLAEALEAVESLTSGFDKARAIAELAPHLPNGLLRRALQTARSLDEFHRMRALTALAPRLPEADKGELLEDILTIEPEWVRAEELAAFAPHLPATRLSTALAASRELQEPDNRAMALTGLVARLAGRQKDDALADAVEAIKLMQLKPSKWAGRFSLADTLAKLAPYLPEDERRDALEAALQELPPPDLSGFPGPPPRASALVTLAPHLRPSDLGEALRAVWAIDEVGSGPYQRVDLLQRLAEPLAALPPTILGPLVSEALANLWAGTRQEFLNELAALVPAIGALGGAAALTETARAIWDVGRWLP